MADAPKPLDLRLLDQVTGGAGAPAFLPGDPQQFLLQVLADARQQALDERQQQTPTDPPPSTQHASVQGFASAFVHSAIQFGSTGPLPGADGTLKSGG